MGNDNKIKISKDEVRLFLQNDMLPSENDAPEFYDLDSEYAKTRKGKSHFTIWVLLACTAVVALMVYGLTVYIGRINSNVSVGIDVFEDLNLKNLLDVVSRTQASLDAATNKKIMLEQDMETELASAELKKDSDLLLLDSLRLTSGEKKRRTEKIMAEYDSAVSSISDKYKPDIAVCSSQIEEYKQQLASYDKKNVELAQQQEAAINSQRQLFEMEKQQLSEEYKKTISDLNSQLISIRVEMLEEQRSAIALLNSQHTKEMSWFDPVLQDDRAEILVSAFSAEQSGQTASAGQDVQGSTEANTYSEKFSMDGFSLELSDDALMEKAVLSLSDIDSRYSDFNHLAELVCATPWKNSLGAYVQTMVSLGNKIGTDTVSMAIDLLQEQEDRLAQVQAQHELERQQLLARIAELETEGKNPPVAEEEAGSVLDGAENQTLPPQEDSLETDSAYQEDSADEDAVVPADTESTSAGEIASEEVGVTEDASSSGESQDELSVPAESSDGGASDTAETESVEK